MSSSPQVTIRRECASLCGTVIAYTIEAGQFAPEIDCDDLVAYKDGHLCTACESIVEAALATRRTAIAAKAFTDSKDPISSHAITFTGIRNGQGGVVTVTGIGTTVGKCITAARESARDLGWGSLVFVEARALESD